MDSELFEVRVREQDRNFSLEEDKVALVIDNCTTHLNIENLHHILLSSTKYDLVFAAYVSRSHSILEVKVSQLRHPENHRSYWRQKTNTFHLCTWSYEDA